ncbi:MAG: methylated-DNA--[protein]-cysteine S-methyltransferase [Deltaproteobacteria bacterium]
MKRNEELNKKSEDYVRIEQAINYLEKHFDKQPDLAAIAKAVNLSKYHFQRLFKRWAGVTPQQFLHFLTLEYTKKLLRESHSVFDASLAAGLSSGSRIHDLFISFDAITPGEYKKFGKGLEILYGYHPTPFGLCLLAITHRGICALRFISPHEQKLALKQLQGEWPEAVFVEKPSATLPIIEKIFSQSARNYPFHLTLKGTNFQVQVWRALLAIPAGAIASYQEIAGFLGRPEATRAVASAIAKNPISYLIPCHRVIRKSGEIHNYRWGRSRKKAMLAWEAAMLGKESFSL